MKTRHIPRTLCGLAFLLTVASANAQWQTQQFLLKPGWTAVYLNVDPSHATLSDTVGADGTNPIDEIWMWQPAPATLQFVTDPAAPSGTGDQWARWDRLLGPSSELQRLVGNAAFLVHNSSGSDYLWAVQGKPLLPANDWTSLGINFIGFPTPEANPPVFANFFGPAPNLSNAEVYHYVGGPLDSSNPIRLFTLNTSPVTRGAAYWVRSGDTFNAYFGPFEVSAPDGTGIRLGSGVKQVRLRLKNLTDTARTITLSLLASEPAPAGQPAIAGLAPVLMRGALNTSTLVYTYNELSAGPQIIVLQPAGEVGSETAVVLGVNRTQMPGAAGDLYAGILRFTDAQNLQQVDLPIEATVTDTSGLWVGGASVSQVRAYLPSYQTDTTGALVTSTDPNQPGAYIVTGVNTDLGGVAEPFPLRLIVHRDAGGNARLLQRVFYGLRQGNEVLATRQSELDPDKLEFARRISAAHLPFSADNPPWSFTGSMQQGMTMTATVPLAYDDQASNPFLHTYHPDHDNLDALFAVKLARGAESYTLERSVTLSFEAPSDHFASLAAGNQELSGSYAEVVNLFGAGSESRQYEVSGSFRLQRISDIATLLPTP